MPDDQQPGDQPGWAPPGWSSPDVPPPPPAAPVPSAPPTPPPAPVAPSGWGGPDQQYGQSGYGQGVYGSYGQPPAPHQGWAPQALRPGVIPLRPLGLGEILDGAVSVIRRYPRQTLGLSALVAVLATVLNIALVLLIPDDFLNGETSGEELSDAQIGSAVASTVGQVVVTLLAGIVLSGIITVVLGKAVLGQPVSGRDAWTQTRTVLWRLLGLSLTTFVIVGLIVGLPLLTFLAGPIGLLFFLPALPLAAWVYVRLSLAGPALVLEKSGIRTSLRRSAVLVKGAWWRIAGILLLASVIASVVGGVLQTPFLLIDGISGDVTTAGQIGVQIGAGLALVLTSPFSSGVTALLYLDRRMRAEGLDVTLAAAAAAATAEQR